MRFYYEDGCRVGAAEKRTDLDVQGSVGFTSSPARGQVFVGATRKLCPGSDLDRYIVREGGVCYGGDVFR